MIAGNYAKFSDFFFFAPVQYALPRACLQQYVDAHLNKKKLGSGQKNATAW